MDRPIAGRFRSAINSISGTDFTTESVFIDAPTSEAWTLIVGGSQVNPAYTTVGLQIVDGLLAQKTKPEDIAVITFYGAQSSK